MADAERRSGSGGLTRPISVLLGNGFSMDYDPHVFGYVSLADEAELRGLSVDKRDLFHTLDTSNFEVAVDKLRSAANLVALQGGDANLVETLRADADVVQHGLAEVIANRHPESAMDLSDDAVVYARTFLSHFDLIFTLNYDLLLYWVLNRDVGPYVDPHDGFEFASGLENNELFWKSNPSQGAQHTYYLHGALHYFRERIPVESVRRWKVVKLARVGRLVSALRRKLRQDQYPMVVTEGSQKDKEARISQSLFLRTAHRRFGEVSGALFVHGASLAPNDDHIWELLTAEESDVTDLYVGIHRPGSRESRLLMGRAGLLQEGRDENGGRPLRLRFYDVATARVWR